MKYLTLLIFILLSNFCNSQTNSKIDKLEKKKITLESQINLLNDSLQELNVLINKLKTKQILSQVNDSTLIGVCKDNSKLKLNPEPLAEIIATLSKGSEVIIIDYIDGYFGVCLDTVCGYMNEIWINKTELLNKFIELKERENESKKSLMKNLKIKKTKEEFILLEKKYIKKYGKTTYDKLRNGYYWIGMTDEMALISLGYPDDINRTVNSWGVYEQWVYKSIYLYFENDILKSYQN